MTYKPTQLPDPTESDDALSDDVQPRSYSRIVRVLIIFSLLILFVPLYAVSTTVKSAQAELQAEFDSMTVKLSATPPVDPTREALLSGLNTVLEQNKMLGSVSATLVAFHIQWPQVMAAISAFDPAQMHITSIAQDNANIILNGQANAELVVMAYTDLLRLSDQFEEVQVQSLSSRLLATPTPPPDTNSPETTEPQRVVDFVMIASVNKTPVELAP
jgi:hypothetical protein